MAITEATKETITEMAQCYKKTKKITKKYQSCNVFDPESGDITERTERKVNLERWYCVSGADTMINMMITVTKSNK
jgi:hypothetical protein